MILTLLSLLSLDPRGSFVLNGDADFSSAARIKNRVLSIDIGNASRGPRLALSDAMSGRTLLAVGRGGSERLGVYRGRFVVRRKDGWKHLDRHLRAVGPTLPIIRVASPKGFERSTSLKGLRKAGPSSTVVDTGGDQEVNAVFSRRHGWISAETVGKKLTRRLGDPDWQSVSVAGPIGDKIWAVTPAGRVAVLSVDNFTVKRRFQVPLAKDASPSLVSVVSCIGSKVVLRTTYDIFTFDLNGRSEWIWRGQDSGLRFVTSSGGYLIWGDRSMRIYGRLVYTKH